MNSCFLICIISKDPIKWFRICQKNVFCWSFHFQINNHQLWCCRYRLFLRKMVFFLESVDSTWWIYLYFRSRHQRPFPIWVTLDIFPWRTRIKTFPCLIVLQTVFAISRVFSACLCLESWTQKLRKLWRCPGMFLTYHDLVRFKQIIIE